MRDAGRPDWRTYYARVWERTRIDLRAHVKGQVAVGLALAVLAGIVAAMAGAGPATLFYAVAAGGTWMILALGYFRVMAPVTLDRELRVALTEAEGTQLVPDLTVEIRAFSMAPIRVTNNGETDTFRADIERPGLLPEKLHWENFSGPLEQQLVKGDHASLHVSLGPGKPNTQWGWAVRILSTKRDPRAWEFTTRTTGLGAVETKPRDAAWPPKPDAWFTEIDQLLTDYRAARERIATMTERAPIEAQLEAFQRRRPMPGVRVLGPNHYNYRRPVQQKCGKEAADAAYVAEYKAWFDQWIEKVEQARNAEASFRDSVGAGR